MPATFALADLLTINQAGVRELGCSDVVNDAPFFAALSADVASNGTLHTYMKEVGAPVIGFRTPNAGTDESFSSDVNVQVALTILAASFSVDYSLANAYTKGGAAAWLEREGLRHLRASFASAESQCFYGSGANNGFTGFANVATMNALTAQMVTNAGGAFSEGLTSVYFVRSGEADVQVITGNNGNIQKGDTTVIRALDGNGKQFPKYYTPMEGWITLQQGSTYSVARLANVGTAAGKTLSDRMLGKTLDMFPANRQPNMIVMNKRSRGQLRDSRTAVNPTGMEVQNPTEYQGIPIIVTEQLTITEPAVV
jgi:hypothetical protein